MGDLFEQAGVLHRGDRVVGEADQPGLQLEITSRVRRRVRVEVCGDDAEELVGSRQRGDHRACGPGLLEHGSNGLVVGVEVDDDEIM